MPLPTDRLLKLVEQLYTDAQYSQLVALAELDEGRLYKWADLLSFDSALSGPGVHNIHNANDLSPGAEGRYDYSDRDVFRPIQYCAVYFYMRDPSTIPWLAREIVHMAGLHLETLTKRIFRQPRMALGQLVKTRASLLRKLVGLTTWEQLRTFSSFYNDAKHDVAQAKDTHLFVPSDAVLAYFITRRLASALYPHARLATARSTWDVHYTITPVDSIW